MYIGDTELTVDELIDKLYEYSIGFQGKHYVAVSIKQKLKQTDLKSGGAKNELQTHCSEKPAEVGSGLYFLEIDHLN